MVKANPNIEINVGARRFAVTPRTVTPADSDYGRLRQIVNDNNRSYCMRYNQYLKATSRPFPVIVLTPQRP